MSTAPATYRWSLADFLRAWEADAFSNRVELVEGEVWPVAIGAWHGSTAARVIRALPNDRFEVTTMSLPSAGSLPDPDCWVMAAGTAPIEQLSRRVVAWAPTDVLLVVEVADDSVEVDLGIKAHIYARAGYACYWVVTPEGVHEHTDATESGYRVRTTYRPGEDVPVHYAGAMLAVSALIAS